MAEISVAGYDSIKSFIEANWKYIEIQTSGGTKIVRRQVGLAGSGATVEPREDTGRTVVIKVVVRGSDADMPALPVIAARSVVRSVNSDSGTIVSNETLSGTFTFQDDGDQLTVYHKIHVPQA